MKIQNKLILGLLLMFGSYGMAMEDNGDSMGSERDDNRPPVARPGAGWASSSKKKACSHKIFNIFAQISEFEYDSRYPGSGLIPDPLPEGYIPDHEGQIGVVRQLIRENVTYVDKETGELIIPRDGTKKKVIQSSKDERYPVLKSWVAATEATGVIPSDIDEARASLRAFEVEATSVRK